MPTNWGVILPEIWPKLQLKKVHFSTLLDGETYQKFTQYFKCENNCSSDKKEMYSLENFWRNINVPLNFPNSMIVYILSVRVLIFITKRYSSFNSFTLYSCSIGNSEVHYTVKLIPDLFGVPYSAKTETNSELQQNLIPHKWQKYLQYQLVFIPFQFVCYNIFFRWL